MDELNALERKLIEAIVEENCLKYPFLRSHIDLLKLEKREFTGVGSFTHFRYEASDLLPKHAILSSEKTLTIEGLENELSFVLNLTGGKMDFLEIVTNGYDAWDGIAENFELK